MKQLALVVLVLFALSVVRPASAEAFSWEAAIAAVLVVPAAAAAIIHCFTKPPSKPATADTEDSKRPAKTVIMPEPKQLFSE